MEDSEISVENTNMQWQCEIKKVVVLLSGGSKLSGPDGVSSRLLREAREVIAGALTKSFLL